TRFFNPVSGASRARYRLAHASRFFTFLRWRESGMSEALKSIPMGSPITFSGFNQIDFNVVLNAIMQQESAPLQALQAKQSELQAPDSTYGQLASKLDSLRTASEQLSDASKLTTYAATSSDTAALTVSASADAA